jgi:hypothetical protein
MNHNLNDIIDSLQSAFDKAQKNIDDQENKRIYRQFEVDEKGQAKSLTWTFCNAIDEGEKQTYELIKVPLHDLYPNSGMRVAELSIELSCVVEKTKNNDENGTDKIVLTQATQGSNQPVHTLKISSHKTVNADNIQSEVSLDGMTLVDPVDLRFSPPIAEEKNNNHRPLKFNTRFRWYMVFLLTLVSFIALLIVFFQNSDRTALVHFIEQLNFDWIDVLEQFTRHKINEVIDYVF